MTFDINYPIPPEYYISWSGEGESLLISYGYIESHRSLTTGLDNLETFTEEAPYLARLAEFGINPNEEETV